MKVTDYIAKALAQVGITHVFLVQGAANNDLIYAIADRDDLHYVCTLHEQAAGFAAEGYAKVKGVPGCAIATSGPGGQNLITSIANCYYDSTACIFITGQVMTEFMKPQGSDLRQLGFQEWPIVDVVKPITKYAVCVTDPDDVPYELAKALRVAMTGRPGPVLLDLPIDVQRADIEDNEMLRLDLTPARVGPDPAKIFIDQFWKAKRPVLLIGGGARSVRAHAALDKVMHALKVPVFPTWNALDVVTSDSTYYGGRVGTYGGAGRNFAIQNCDLLLSIGSRVSGRITGGKPETFAREATRWMVDIDDGVLDPHYQPQQFHYTVHSDAGAFLESLLFAYHAKCSHYNGDPEAEPNHTEWTRKALQWRDQYDPVKPEFFRQEKIHPYAFMRMLSHHVPANAVIINDCGGNAVVTNHAFETQLGQRYFSNNGNSPMGFSFSAAIGAYFADPTRPIICIIGDGGFCLNVQELQTLKNYHIPVKTFILDNRCYGITKAYQDTNMGGRYEACGPVGYTPPDFYEVVNAFGIKTVAIFNPEFLQSAIQKVLVEEEAVVAVVECPDFYTYEPKISGWATPIEDMSPLLPRDEFKANMIVAPMRGWETGEYK
jgi:acetolactate synthase I/II/III large subunit